MVLIAFTVIVHWSEIFLLQYKWISKNWMLYIKLHINSFLGTGGREGLLPVNQQLWWSNLLFRYKGKPGQAPFYCYVLLLILFAWFANYFFWVIKCKYIYIL